jgi:hypothetical protein
VLSFASGVKVASKANAATGACRNASATIPRRQSPINRFFIIDLDLARGCLEAGGLGCNDEHMIAERT